MDNIYPINSKMYWDERFKSGSWSDRLGEGQSNYFAEVMIANLPNEIFTEIFNNKYSILDFGCALGQLCNLWSKTFHTKNIVGLDLSEEAVKIASELYPSLKFTSKSINENDKYDCIVCSNVLEHLENYRDYLELFSKVAQKYIIVLIPYNGMVFDEHVVSLNEDSFPCQVGEFRKTFEKVIQCNDERYWNDKQLLCIYSKN